VHHVPFFQSRVTPPTTSYFIYSSGWVLCQSLGVGSYGNLVASRLWVVSLLGPVTQDVIIWSYHSFRPCDLISAWCPASPMPSTSARAQYTTPVPSISASGHTAQPQGPANSL